MSDIKVDTSQLLEFSNLVYNMYTAANNQNTITKRVISQLNQQSMAINILKQNMRQAVIMGTNFANALKTLSEDAKTAAKLLICIHKQIIMAVVLL